ncbi:MAG: pyrroloquinoline quinone biosynthesis protein PqqB [Gemmatimonadota bacterium]|nr:pyrroloquinoline quinone biosynthesis protein PqqB [Gemmatimonadota bacterium]
MEVVLLGTAAGGGFPQWNCWCPPCATARASPAAAHPRTQSAAAVSADGRHWFLLNASPDVREQIGRLNGARPSTVRHVPLEGIVVTDAELDHTLGIALVREARQLRLYATPAVRSVLESDSRILPVTRAFAAVELRELELGEETPLLLASGEPSGLTVECFAVHGDPPRFASRELPGHTVGLLIRQPGRSGTCAFVPGCGELDDALLQRLGTVDLVLFDGTFWRDDELLALGISTSTAREMGHVPVSGAGGSLERLRLLPARWRVYTHINNSNPMLIEHSAERAAVTAAGLQVGDDGMRFQL